MALLAVLAACSTAPPPQTGTGRNSAPSLNGFKVMVLPVQEVVDVGGDPDAEMRFGLGEHGSSVEWVWPDRIERALERAPSMDARTRGLPVAPFLRAEVRRIGDPLYGLIRRLSALVDADVALLPVRAARESVDSAGTTAVRIHAVLLDVRTGRVLWFGVEEGAPHPPDDPRALASAVDALARNLLRSTGRR